MYLCTYKTITMTKEKRILYLKNIVKSLEIDPEKKYRKNFEKQSRYMGSGVYEWNGLLSKDTQILFLKGVLYGENITGIDFSYSIPVTPNLSELQPNG